MGTENDYMFTKRYPKIVVFDIKFKHNLDCPLSFVAQRWLSGKSVCLVSGRSCVRSPTAAYQRRYKNGTKCVLA